MNAAMPGVESVVFDLGGVLIEWDPKRLYRKLLPDDDAVEQAISEIDLYAFNEELDRGRTFEEAAAERLERHPHRRREIEAYRDRWPETLGDGISGTVGILDELHSAGYPLYALTNWSAETFPVARERFDFLSVFDEIIVSGEEGLVKPDLRLYDVLIRKTGIEPSRSVFIDDRPENVRAAEESGFHGIVYVTPDQLRRDLESLNVSVKPASP